MAGYRIIPIRKEDILKIKQWRNEQISVLRQTEPLTDKDQLEYYMSVILPSQKEQKPEQMLYSFILDDELIGYGGITHINWKDSVGEVSFLLETSRTHDMEAYKQEFYRFLTLLKIRSPLQKLVTETYEGRPHHVEVLKKCGFKLMRKQKGSLFHEYAR